MVKKATKPPVKEPATHAVHYALITVVNGQVQFDGCLSLEETHKHLDELITKAEGAKHGS